MKRFANHLLLIQKAEVNLPLRLLRNLPPPKTSADVNWDNRFAAQYDRLLK